MNEQQFQHGDLVMIAEDLGPHKSHFTSNCQAIVVASYAEQFGGSNNNQYTLYIEDNGEISWYDVENLTLIERGRTDLLEQWKKAATDEAELKGSLDWIFANGENVLAYPHGASMSALAACLGVTNLWGSNGEGFVYAMNVASLLTLAEKYLIAGDKDGWLNYCERAKNPAPKKIFRFKNWDCYVQKSRYQHGNAIALQVLTADTPHNQSQETYPDELIATASVNLDSPVVPLEEGETFIKDYSENEGMLKALVDAGIVENTGATERTGFVEVFKVRVL